MKTAMKDINRLAWIVVLVAMPVICAIGLLMQLALHELLHAIAAWWGAW